MPPTRSFEDLLKELSAASSRRPRSYEAEEAPWAAPRRPRVGFPVVGCLIRFIGMLLVLAAAGILFLFLFFGGALS